ncbi:hypothetical protein [Streptomyces griseoviridis]|uniref:hypothetical protein n=1 Tax=Streptomyces griseoviridis TaxID=45398 RepID=UPI00341B6144
MGDGLLGCADSGPYDRVMATVGVRRGPPAWIGQTRSGGVILVPWGTSCGNTDAVLRLTVRGTSPRGRSCVPCSS